MAFCSCIQTVIFFCASKSFDAECDTSIPGNSTELLANCVAKVRAPVHLGAVFKNIGECPSRKFETGTSFKRHLQHSTPFCCRNSIINLGQKKWTLKVFHPGHLEFSSRLSDKRFFEETIVEQRTRRDSEKCIVKLTGAVPLLAESNCIKHPRCDTAFRKVTRGLKDWVDVKKPGGGGPVIFFF